MRYFLLILVITLSSSCTTRYFVVRHAEKEDSGRDPDLSAAGKRRAEALKGRLLREQIDTIFVSGTKRTQQTAAPLATLLVKECYVYPATLKGNEELINLLTSFRGNKTILVVGHSNTVPIVVDSLMKAPQQITIAENDYDNLYIISIRRFLSAKRELTISTYGEPVR